MERQIVSFKSQSAEYDFAKDGGAVGAIPSGIWLSPNSIVVFFCIKIITALAGDVTSTVGFSVNTTGGGTPNCFAPTVIGSVTGLVVGSNYTAASVFAIASSGQVTMNIGAKALTGGKFIFNISYYENLI